MEIMGVCLAYRAIFIRSIGVDIGFICPKVPCMEEYVPT